MVHVTGRRRFVSSATRRILQFSGVGESTAPGPRLRRTDERNAERAPVAQRVHDPLSPAAASNLSDADRTPRSYRSPLTRARLACRIGSHRAFNRDHPNKLPATVGPAQPRIRPPGRTMPNAALRRTGRASTESTAPPRLRSHRSAPGSCQPCAGPDYAVDKRRDVSSSSADHEDLRFIWPCAAVCRRLLRCVRGCRLVLWSHGGQDR